MKTANHVMTQFELEVLSKAATKELLNQVVKYPASTRTPAQTLHIEALQSTAQRFDASAKELRLAF